MIDSKCWLSNLYFWLPILEFNDLAIFWWALSFSFYVKCQQTNSRLNNHFRLEMVLVKATVQHPGSFNSFSVNKFESYNVIKNAIYKFGNF